MGTITKWVAKNGDVSWQGKVRRKGYPSQTRTFGEKKECEKWIRATEAAMDRGEGAAPIKQTQPQPHTDGLNTLADVLQRYRDTVSPEHRGGWIEVLTINKWLTEAFVKTPLTDVTATVIAAWRDERLKRLKPASVSRQMNLLYGAINRARAEWGCPIPDCKVARPRNPPHRERVLADEEELILLSGARAARNPHLAPVIEFALATAMRAGEIIGLRWADIDLNRRVARLSMTKNGAARDVPLSSRALAALDRVERMDERVFYRLNSDGLKHQFARLAARCKLDDLHFHDLRHTAITRYARTGMNTLQLSVISGHKDVRMLARYTHLKADELVGMMG
ncbi:tyrosine-type recombinase/integrase [Burkholderia gladioli]|uniref:tyrosine-type recombinase/integrase n=1 Tax=Burkholderia gladioli TaxID=28095 RepID=UPI0016422A56|nr:site-specific integrase [Burkholderia gladioli]